MGMDLKQFANLDSLYRDLDTGREIPYEEYMQRVIDKLGIENIAPYIPFSIPFLKEKFKKDYYFNNTNLISWERAAGFLTSHFKADVTYIGMGIGSLFLLNGINVFSCSDGVSVLKSAARMLCEMEGNENDSHTAF